MLEITIARPKVFRVLEAIRQAACVQSLRREQTDGDQQDVTYCITELPDGSESNIEAVLDTFGADVQYGWL